MPVRERIMNEFFDNADVDGDGLLSATEIINEKNRDHDRVPVPQNPPRDTPK